MTEGHKMTHKAVLHASGAVFTVLHTADISVTNFPPQSSIPSAASLTRQTFTRASLHQFGPLVKV